MRSVLSADKTPHTNEECFILSADKTPQTNKEEVYRYKVTARDVLSTIWQVNGLMNY